MAKIKVWERVDGGISISGPYDCSKKNAGETDEQYVDRISSKLRDLPHLKGAQEHIIDDDKIPKERTNRNEWGYKNGKVEVDQTKLQAKLDKEAEKLAKKNSIKQKLGLTDDELGMLVK